MHILNFLMFEVAFIIIIKQLILYKINTISMGCIGIKSYYHLNIQNTYAMFANIVPFLNIKYSKIVGILNIYY